MGQILSKFSNQAKGIIVGGLLLMAQLFSAQCSETGWAKVAQGENFTVALKSDGTLWVWGRNLYGLLGDGTGANTEIKHPTKIGNDSNWTDVSAGRYFALGKKANGDLYGWGANDYGQLGLGNGTNVFSPTLIQQNVSAFSAGYYHTAVVKTDGTLWSAGYNEWGNLGMGSLSSYNNTFIQEATNATNWKSVGTGYYNSFAIKTDGTLWTAGSNVYGQNGLGTPATAGGNTTSTFTKVGTDTNWDSVSGGFYHAVGLKTNGELWSWGLNNDGRLGLGTTGGTLYVPQQVPGNTWKSVSATYNGSAGLKTDGSLWTWGSNEYGKLGIGNNTDANVPTQVGTDNNWSNIPSRYGYYSTAAVKTDTSMYSWGWDGYWQLGNSDGTTTNSNVPTKVTCADTVLGVNDVISNKKVSLYPNPAKDFIVLESAKSVKIYNMVGSVVKSFNDMKDSKINISDLPAGIYIVKINDSNEGIKLIKK